MKITEKTRCEFVSGVGVLVHIKSFRIKKKERKENRTMSSDTILKVDYNIERFTTSDI